MDHASAETLFGIAELVAAALLIAIGDVRLAGAAVGMGPWLLTFAVGQRG